MVKRSLRSIGQRLFVRPVVAGSGAELFVEHGDIGLLHGADRVALVASWSDHQVMSRSLSIYLSALIESGFVPIVISTSQVPERLEWPWGLPRSVIVFRRRNIGYDFGTWAAVLEALPEIRKCKHVLLTNDSMVGPFSPIKEILDSAMRSNADLVGLTDTFQIYHSIQSYFMMFNRGALDSAEWREFFRGVRPQKTKMDYVWYYESRVANVAVSGGFGWETLFPSVLVDALYQNPLLDYCEELINLGFPFAKRTLWTDRSFADQTQRVESVLRARFGIEVEQWLPQQTPVLREFDGHVLSEPETSKTALPYEPEDKSKVVPHP